MNQLEVPKTNNASFNACVNVLHLYHPIINLGGFPALDFEKKPKIKTDEDWRHYFGALHEFFAIGNRNGWIRAHVDKWGRAAWIIIEAQS